MTIAAKVSATEVTNIVNDRYVDQYFEARLINLPAYDYDPSVAGADTTLLAGEVAVGTGGYQRAYLSWSTGEVGAYADGGVALSQKATVFEHDGGATALTFSHVALVWSSGNALTLGAVTAAPASATTTTAPYTNIPVDSTSGSGFGLTVDLEVTNSGAATTDYVVTINKPGYDYAASDTVTINNGTLAGLDPSLGAGDLTFPVATVYTPSIATAGDLFTVVKTTSSVNLVDGNQAAFYWNVKQFGFYTAP
jgi:hypothetical protein